MPIIMASDGSAPGPAPNITRPRVMVVELHHAVGDDQGMVVGQRHHAGAQPDVLGALGGRGDEHFRARR